VLRIFFYKYKKDEIEKLLSSLVVLVDKREKVNNHIIDYFEKRNIQYKIEKLKTGEYSAMLPKNDEYGIVRDLYYPIAIERKNSVDELVASITDRNRFENELIRAQKIHFILLVEEQDGYEKLIRGDYISKYNPKALLGSLKAFESRYDFATVYQSQKVSGNFIFHHLYYYIREMLMEGRI